VLDLDEKKLDISQKMVVKIQAFKEFKEILGEKNNFIAESGSKKETKIP
jgi:hypothetical protein